MNEVVYLTVIIPEFAILDADATERIFIDAGFTKTKPISFTVGYYNGKEFTADDYSGKTDLESCYEEWQKRKIDKCEGATIAAIQEITLN
jgi:hypothetical protein